jgi:hypothetical protein
LILHGRRSVAQANEVADFDRSVRAFQIGLFDNRCTLPTDACPPRILRLPNTGLPLGQFTLSKLSVSAAPTSVIRARMFWVCKPPFRSRHQSRGGEALVFDWDYRLRTALLETAAPGREHYTQA